MSKPNKVERFLGMIPLKTLLVVTAAGLLFGEQYPLSHYPMYSNFDGVDFYVFITDQNGEPLPCKAMHTSAAKVKKRFNGKIKKAAKAADVRERELDRAVLEELGLETLESYMGQTDRDGRMASVTEIRLMRVDLLAEEKEITKTEWQVAALPFPPPRS